MSEKPYTVYYAHIIGPGGERLRRLAYIADRLNGLHAQVDQLTARLKEWEAADVVLAEGLKVIWEDRQRLREDYLKCRRALAKALGLETQQ